MPASCGVTNAECGGGGRVCTVLNPTWKSSIFRVEDGNAPVVSRLCRSWTCPQRWRKRLVSAFFVMLNTALDPTIQWFRKRQATKAGQPWLSLWRRHHLLQIESVAFSEAAGMGSWIMTLLSLRPRMLAHSNDHLRNQDVRSSVQDDHSIRASLMRTGSRTRFRAMKQSRCPHLLRPIPLYGRIVSKMLRPYSALVAGRESFSSTRLDNLVLTDENNILL